MAEGLDTLLKPMGSRGGRRGWARVGRPSPRPGPLTSLGNPPNQLSLSLVLGAPPGQPSHLVPQYAWPWASHLQITLVVGLDHLRCCTTKSLPPIMEPEWGTTSRQKSRKSEQQVPRPKQVGWQEHCLPGSPQRWEQLSWAPRGKGSECTDLVDAGLAPPRAGPTSDFPEPTREKHAQENAAGIALTALWTQWQPPGLGGWGNA